ncbi:hypothetical protein EUGRSUZ_L00666 [Eucalyptus grandis]|uniref:Uncharacterized protein n=1 Tax=Eucalyptus grandis TaxID=71139 RepID=A0A058ZUW4_EUCGR|nr:hypothetical protein EUGRSUZ_L00666 [Eucalyptus grandis]
MSLCALVEHIPRRQIKRGIGGGENLLEDEPRPLKHDWIISIKENLDRAEQDPRAQKHSIYRIPHYLKDGKEKAYVPRIVCLGPYHRSDRNLRKMDRHKWRCLKRILTHNNQKIENYLHAVNRVEKRARACYEETRDMSSNEFVEMMVLDGCFVNELFWGFSNGFNELGYTHDDPVFSLSRSSLPIIRRDMILLENQIPLLILHPLFCLQHGPPDQGGPPDQDELLAKLALKFFDPLKPIDRPLHCDGSTSLESNPLPCEFRKGIDHCLELFRWSLLHPDPKRAANEESSQIGQQWQQFIHCVTELRKKGIKFKKGEVGGFRNIQFKDGTLEIPLLVIQDATRSVFLNLIAFEQCHFNCGNDVISYLFFMDHLINSAEDVGHLHDCGIMEHWLGSDAEVADLFNQLGKEVVFVDDGSYLSKLSKDVNAYSGNKWNSWIAILELKYFNNPWSIISLVAAFILLVLTLAQTLYGVFGYYRPGS